MKNRFDIFIAYASTDRLFALNLWHALSPHCTVFLDSKFLKPGDNWAEEIREAQQQSLITAILVSSRTDLSFYQKEEIAIAIDLVRDGMRLHRAIPVIRGAVDKTALPYGIRQLQAIHCRKGKVKEVAEEILRVLSDLREEPDFLSRVAAAGAASVSAEVVIRPSWAPAKSALDKKGRALEELNTAHLRSLFYRALHEKLDGRVRPFALALVDIDDQSRINEKFGSEAGDHIINVVHAMVKEWAKGKACGRLGADSFYLFIEDLSTDSPLQRMRDFCSAVENHNWDSIANGLHVSCTVGIAIWRQGENASTLVRRSIEGVRKGKFAGGNQARSGPLFSNLEGDFPQDWS
ncbi:MAG: diguanylate cyclase [Acidobacteria bacterium]|nr:diguanylate cyclase [Acidobacteriota bacterium]